uniref:Kringle-containing protein marking the eye and the nose n=1 Tax=Leptobrachium leishanense TaxID=445787 RepID=A0A8C5QER3_9ANUR
MGASQLMLVLGFIRSVRLDVTMSEMSECFTVNGQDYRGSASRAGPEGISCIHWNQTMQHLYNTRVDPDGKLGLGSHNYCRNPDADVQPWCYVSDSEEGIYWKYCDIPTCHMPGYIGCFLDFGSPPALPGASATSAKLTVQTCIRFCRRRGYPFAGLEAGYACFCGNESDVAALKLTSNAQCDQACFGRPNELCGGDGRLSVYSAWVGACQGNVSSVSGVLYSPDFPDDYSAGSACSWDIRTPGSNAMELHFHFFHVLDPSDVLELTEKPSGNLLAQIRGGETPAAIVVLPTGHLRVTFRANERHGGPGYAITYRGVSLSPTASLNLGSVISSTSLYAFQHKVSADAGHGEAPAQDGPQCSLSSCAWIYLTAAASLFALITGLMMCRYFVHHQLAVSPSAGAVRSLFSRFYTCRREQGGDLTCVNQSSLKSLI